MQHAFEWKSQRRPPGRSTRGLCAALTDATTAMPATWAADRLL
jgi:hypothetical protein